MIAVGVISEKFLMPAITNISKKYELSETVAGILIAFGIAVPELAVTLLSFQRHGIKMTEFGLATCFGGAVFCTTFVPGFAYLVNYGLLNPRPAIKEAEIESNKRLMKAFLRDMIFTLLGLLAFYNFLQAESLALWQMVLLLVFFCSYIAVIVYMQYTDSLETERQQKLEEAIQKASPRTSQYD